MMRAFIFVAAVAIIAGCAVETTKPAQRVDVPVYVKCKIDKPQKPAWATKSIQPGSDVFTQMRAALVEIKQRAGYELLLESAIDGCG